MRYAVRGIRGTYSRIRISAYGIFILTIIQRTYVCKNRNKTKIELDQAFEGRVSERGAVDPTAGIPLPQSDGQTSKEMFGGG